MQTHPALAGQQAMASCRCHARPFSSIPHGRPTSSKPRAHQVAAKVASASSDAAASRRTIITGPGIIGLGLAASSSLQLATAGRSAAEVEAAVGQGFLQYDDKTHAFTLLYPTTNKSGGALQMTLTHPSEKYSSAAPLTADARQRIVWERFDLTRFITVSMTVGPASGVLKDQPPSEWRPRDVALTVLIDRSTARLSSGQRTALNDVEEVHEEERDGQKYVVYEHISQGSPTIQQRTGETYRHALAVTTMRPALSGTPYLYTLNLSCPESLWSEMEPQFRVSADSFRLVTPGSGYIAPDKDPWLFF